MLPWIQGTQRIHRTADHQRGMNSQPEPARLEETQCLTQEEQAASGIAKTEILTPPRRILFKTPSKYLTGSSGGRRSSRTIRRLVGREIVLHFLAPAVIPPSLWFFFFFRLPGKVLHAFHQLLQARRHMFHMAHHHPWQGGSLV